MFLLLKSYPKIRRQNRHLERAGPSLVEVKVGKVWRSYLTSVLDPEVLPPYVVVDLSENRWRIEAEPDHQRCLGIVKRQRKPNKKLIVAHDPERQRGSD
jgi:hypothetical protein